MLTIKTKSMKKLNHFLVGTLSLTLFFASCSSEETPDTPESTRYKYDYETVEGDPLNTMIYTLDNGLKLYMSINKDEPRVQTNIAVNTGSKQDPADATGLAHYLEHMLFKGTSRIGTSNWEEESKLLQQISDLYEQHRNTTDAVERKAIYHQIDSISNVASGYAIANEYDKMVASLGAKGTNAYTSLEQTVYINDIPSNELEKWLKLESERFSELVLRLFHTELEAVYEEFNRGQDSDGQQAYFAIMRNLFKKHSYGTQTTIGKGEHLKNPSMEKIHAYFDKYYVPNNMAIILAGDLDPDKTVELVEQYFGGMERKEVEEFTFEPEDEITAPIEVDIEGTNAEFVEIAYRIGGAASEDALKLQLVDGILSNGQAGLIDLNLVQKQKVLRASSGPYINKDYSIMFLSATPREGQSLEEARDLLLEQIELVKQGAFEDWLMDAVVKDLKLSETRQFENNWARASVMTDAFIHKRDWADMVSEKDRMAKITKEEVVAFANAAFGDNYVVVNKRTGEPNVFKIEKPEITPIQIEREEQSAFMTEFDSVQSSRLEPVFIDYESAISNKATASGIPFSYIENTTNEVFELYYILDMGSDNDKEMALAVKYLPYLGTSKYSAEDLQKEFFKLGVSFDVFSSRDRVYVTLSGLEESLEQGIALFEEVLSDVTPDEQAYTDFVDGIMKKRADAKLNKSRIHRRAMMDFAKYGDDSPLKNILSKTDMDAITPASLVEKIKSITGFKHRVFYYGRKNEADVIALLDQYHKVPEQLADYPEAKTYVEQEMTANKVYFVNYDMVQAEMLMISKAQPFDKGLMAKSNIFNQYFGSGLSSIVFQEIRESKALAYSAYSYFSTPGKKEDSHYVQAYVGSQVDKLEDATAAILELMNDMPEAEMQFEAAKEAALKQIETSRTTKTSIFWSYETAKKRGLSQDSRKEIYNEIQNITMADVKAFFESNIKGRNYSFLVIGNKELVDTEVLKSLGEYQELTLEQIFGY